jgi:hypothetical protein
MIKKRLCNFECEHCDYTTPYKSNLNRHIKTTNHFSTIAIKKGLADNHYNKSDDNTLHYKKENNSHQTINTIFNTFQQKTTTQRLGNFKCDHCDYNTPHKSNLNRHIKTTKHEVVVNHSCKICNKSYKERTGLWYHEKKCTGTPDVVKMTTLFIESMKQNQEFQKEIIGIIKDSCGVTNSNNTNSNNNTKFNLNFFLNETCKDAMNLTEFVDSLKITLADLENVGKLGYTEGISRIFTKGLKELEIHKRPIHCSDLKRETVYVKNENKWEKERDHLKKAIKQITNKNIRLIPKWKEDNPGHHEYHNKKNDEYLKIMYESMGPTDEIEETKTFGKIITNLAKETIILKTSDGL